MESEERLEIEGLERWQAARMQRASTCPFIFELGTVAELEILPLYANRHFGYFCQFCQRLFPEVEEGLCPCWVFDQAEVQSRAHDRLARLKKEL